MDDLTQREFLLELEELTEQMFAVTGDLRLPEASGPQLRDTIARAFRCLHSLKGVASSAGLAAVAELAHKGETVLDLARSGRIRIDRPFVDMLEDVAHTLAESVAEATSGRSERAADILGRRLSALAAEAAGTDAAVMPLADLPAPLANSLNEREKLLINNALRRGPVFSIDATFEIAAFDTEFQRLRETLTQYGEVICTQPSAAGAAANTIAFKLFYTSELDASELQTHALAVAPDVLVSPLFPTLPVTPDTAPQPGAAAVRVTGLSSPGSVIRVELAELDRLRANAHAIFAQLLEQFGRVSTSLTGAERTECTKLQAQLRQSFAALGEQIVALRTIPVGRVIQRAIRAGQLAARSTGKEVDFKVTGAELRIDKEVCDAIATPLIHLIRNAVDHGIESPAQRTNAGKTPAGKVCIEAHAKPSEIAFVVSDDGRGIDPQMISLAAATRGLIEQDTVLDMDQSLRLIFRAGFSTAQTVSSLSGRGVGLDVVGNSLAEIGGSVSVQSWPGKGSAFTLHLPQPQLQPS